MKNESPFLIGRLRKSRLSFSSPNGRTFLKPYVKTENTVFRPAVTDLLLSVSRWRNRAIMHLVSN